MLRALVESFMAALTRFWDNRFVPFEDEEVNFLRLEIEKERAEKNKLLNFVLEMNQPKQELQIDVSNYKPLEKDVPFSRRRILLEQQDRDRVQALKREYESKTKPSAVPTTEIKTESSVEELEAELGITND